MARRRRSRAEKVNREERIICNAGMTTVEFGDILIALKYRPWFIQVNPRFLFPSLRKGHRKIIKVNGKKRGYAEVREGLNPLPRYRLPGQGFTWAVNTFIRKAFGFKCKSYEKGYIFVKFANFKYVVNMQHTEAGFRICEVWDLKAKVAVGKCIFSQDLKELYAHPYIDGITGLLYLVAGYVADTFVYDLAARQTYLTMKIITN